MRERVIACTVLGAVVTLTVQVAGPFALVAWLVAALPWILAAEHHFDSGLTHWPGWLAMAVELQLVLDWRWPYVGDAWLVLWSYLGLTDALRRSSFPRARVIRRPPCSSA